MDNFWEVISTNEDEVIKIYQLSKLIYAFDRYSDKVSAVGNVVEVHISLVASGSLGVVEHAVTKITNMPKAIRIYLEAKLPLLIFELFIFIL